MVLKRYLRGSILIILALGALSVMVTVATRLALATVDRIESGEIPAGMSNLTEIASASVSNADSQITNIAMVVLIVCWLFGIIDSYRLGRASDKSIDN